MTKVKERDIQHEIREALGLLDGVVLWRNNSGFADYNGTKVRYGLAVGSSDLIGICDGRFIALEVKRPGNRPTEEQRAFLRCVRTNGGFACVVTSVDEAKAAIERSRAGEIE